MTGGAGVIGDALHFPGTSLISSMAISPRKLLPRTASNASCNVHISSNK